jgi:MFS transporter, DHA1 family, tetracycline resistance protein
MNSPTNHTALWMIIVMMALNAIGMTIVFPVLPFLVEKYLPDSQIVIGVSTLAAVYTLCQFFAAPVLGALSDCFGRKPILVASLLGSTIGYVLFGVGGALWVLFLGRIIDGITAGDISTLAAYVADSTERHERAKWFGYVGAAMGIG